MKSHRDDAAAFSHQRSGGPRQLGQRMGADFQRRQERVALDLHVFAFQCFARCKRDAVNQKIEPAEFLAHSPESLVYFFLFGHVAREQERAGHLIAGELLDIFLQSLTLVSKSQARARLMQRLGRRPRNRSFVRHPKNNSSFVLQQNEAPFRWFTPRLPSIIAAAKTCGFVAHEPGEQLKPARAYCYAKLFMLSNLPSLFARVTERAMPEQSRDQVSSRLLFRHKSLSSFPFR